MDFPKRGCAVVGLPDDPLVEILSRVPVKSICRFKCVSKAWRDLIADPLHRRKLPKTLEGFFYGHSHRPGEICGGDAVGGVRIHGCGDGGDGGRSGCSKWLGCVFIDLMGRSAPLVDPSFSFLTEELQGMEHVRIVHSCNGLLLLRHGTSQDADTLGYVVCNPATEEWVAVQAADGDNNDTYIGEDTFLFLDPAVSSRFRLLQFSQKDRFPPEVGVRTYSSETGVWTDRSGEQKRLEEGGESLRLGSFWSILSLMGSAIVNGVLHFIANHYQKEQDFIVAVDWEGKTRKVISLPRSHGCSRSEPAFVGQSQGRLYCITEDREDSISEDIEDSTSEDIEDSTSEDIEDNSVLITEDTEDSISDSEDIEDSISEDIEDSTREDIEDNSVLITIWVLEDYDKEEWVTKHCVSSFQLFGKAKWYAHCDYNLVAIHPDRDLIFISHRGHKLISYDMESKEVKALGTFIKKL